MQIKWLAQFKTKDGLVANELINVDGRPSLIHFRPCRPNIDAATRLKFEEYKLQPIEKRSYRLTNYNEFKFEAFYEEQ